jgi:acetyl esterase
MSKTTLRYDPANHFEIDELDVEYRRDDDGPLLARVYRPRGDGPFPALLDVHGGAWNTGTRESDAPMNRVLAANGIVVVAIDFRLAPAHPYPASMVDVNYATRWLKSKAPDFGASPDRIGLLGSSSGGHIVVLSAMRPVDPRYAALPLADGAGHDASASYVIAGWPVLDPLARYHYARAVGRDELVRSTENYFGNVDTMREASPTLILERGEVVDLPPVLVVYGTADANVPQTIVESFIAAYRVAGGVAELVTFPGAPHGFGNQSGPDADGALAAVKEFIARCLTPSSG